MTRGGRVVRVFATYLRGKALALAVVGPTTLRLMGRSRVLRSLRVLLNPIALATGIAAAVTAFTAIGYWAGSV